MVTVLAIAAWAGADAPAQDATPAPVPWEAILRQPAGWYATGEAQRIADTVLRYQRRSGGWPKNIDMARELAPDERRALAVDSGLDDATIDNGATVTQLRFLGRVASAADEPRFRSAFVAGLDFLLAAQYAVGGWPQVFPLRADYTRHLTFNDDATINVATLLREVAGGRAPVGFVDAARRARAADAVARATSLVLRTQIRVEGRLTGWCQQYDATSLRPTSGRSYEHPSIASRETVGIARFLMAIELPDAATVAAIDGAAAWLRDAALTGVRLERRADPAVAGGVDVVVVADPSAPPIWARFYEIGTNRPIYSGRDGVIRARLADIDVERRTGYSWLGPYAADLLAREYPAWTARRRAAKPKVVIPLLHPGGLRQTVASGSGGMRSMNSLDFERQKWLYQ